MISQTQVERIRRMYDDTDATMSDIARACGVSYATVSKYVSDRSTNATGVAGTEADCLKHALATDWRSYADAEWQARQRHGLIIARGDGLKEAWFPDGSGVILQPQPEQAEGGDPAPVGKALNMLPRWLEDGDWQKAAEVVEEVIRGGVHTTEGINRSTLRWILMLAYRHCAREAAEASDLVHELTGHTPATLREEAGEAEG